MQKSTEESQRVSVSKHKVLLSCIIFFISSLVFHSCFTVYLEKNFVFTQNDVLFDSDPVGKLRYLAFNPKPWQKSYPNLFFLTSFLSKAGSYTLVAIGVKAKDSPELRTQVAIFVVPVLSALKIVIFYLLMLSLGLDFWAAILMSVISFFSFSNIIFGSLPDAYGISSLVITISIFLAALEIIQQKRLPIAVWIVCGVFIGSILITNMFIFSCIIFVVFANRYEDILKSAKVCTMVLLAVCLLITLTHFAFRATSGYYHSKAFHADAARNAETVAEPFANLREGNKLTKYLLRYDPFARFFIEFPVTLSSSILLPGISLRGPGMEDNHPAEKTRISSHFSNDASFIEWILTSTVFLCIVFGSWTLYKKSIQHSKILLLCIFLISFNWIFHSIWGGPDIFLYSQHWTVASLVLLSGNLCRLDETDKIRHVILVLLAGLVVSSTIYRIIEIAEVLA